MSDPHAQALATLRAAIEMANGEDWRGQIAAAIAILERPQALEGNAGEALAALEHSRQTAANDDHSTPHSVERERHGQRLDAMEFATATISDLTRWLGEAEAECEDLRQRALACRDEYAIYRRDSAVALASAREENGKLREALAPFAAEAERRKEYLGTTPDDWPIGGSALTSGDLRRAALASTASPETDSGPVAVAPPPAGGAE